MRILFATRKYPPSVGGMELFAYELARALAAQTDVNLKLVKWSGHGRLRTVLLGLPYLTIKAKLALLRGGVDIVHAQDTVVAPPLWLLARLFRKKFTVVIHGLDVTYRNPLFRTVVPRAVKRADAVFCISQAAADEVKKHGVSEEKIVVVPLAVNDNLYQKASREDLLQKLALPGDSQLLLTVGRLVQRKGVSWFVENVLPDLVKKYPKLVYLAAGEGSKRPNIEAAIRETGLGKHVRLLGKVSDDLYRAAYNGADVFVTPNIPVAGDMEGFGLVNLEAALCRLPVVAADIEGIRDAVVDGQNGVLVPARDAAAFQREIARFLDDKKYSQDFGRNSRQFTLENYRWDKLAEQYLKRYQQLLRQNRKNK